METFWKGESEKEQYRKDMQTTTGVFGLSVEN